MDILGHLGFELRVFRPARRNAQSALKPLEIQRWKGAVRAAIISGFLVVRQHTFLAEG